MSNIAMDPLSITTNILTLLGVIWGIVRIVSSCREYPTELSYVLNQLELAKMRCHFWSENVGISKGELQHSQHERLVDPEIRNLVYNTLSNIDYLLSEEALGQIKSVNSILIRLKWAFVSKKKCLSQVQRIRDSVQDLHLLVPQPSMSIDRQPFTSYMLFVDTDGTDFYLKVKDCKPVKSFVSALKKARQQQRSSDKEFMQGLFCFVDENPHDASLASPYRISGQEAILADIWERNVWPGRRLKLIVFDTSIPEREQYLMLSIFRVHVGSTC